MDDLSTLADEIMMSQNAACHDTSRCLPPDVMYVRRTPNVIPVRRTPDVTTVRRTSDVTPVRRTPDVTPVRRTPDVTPVRRTPDVMPVRRTPDVLPRPAETTDGVVPVQRANWHANHNQFHATLESNGLCSYHNKFGNRAGNVSQAVDGFQKTSQAVVSVGERPPIHYNIPSKLTVQHALHRPDSSSKTNYQITASWLIQVLSVLSCLLLVTLTPSTTLLHLTSSQPTVPQSARMVNNKSTYVSPVKPTPGPSSSLMYVIHCLEPISYRTTA